MRVDYPRRPTGGGSKGSAIRRREVLSACKVREGGRDNYRLGNDSSLYHKLTALHGNASEARLRRFA